MTGILHELLDPNELSASGDKLPNESRNDGSPWYSLRDSPMTFFNGDHPCCGAVFSSTEALKKGDELLFEYGLHEPLPVWAEGWYASD